MSTTVPNSNAGFGWDDEDFDAMPTPMLNNAAAASVAAQTTRTVSASAPTHSPAPLESLSEQRAPARQPQHVPASSASRAPASSGFSEDVFDDDFHVYAPSTAQQQATFTQKGSAQPLDTKSLERALPTNTASSATKQAPPTTFDDDGWGEDPEDDMPTVQPSSRQTAPVAASGTPQRASNTQQPVSTHLPKNAESAPKPTHRAADMSAPLSYTRAAAPAAKKTTAMVSHSAFDDFDAEEPEPAPVATRQEEPASYGRGGAQSGARGQSSRFAYGESGDGEIGNGPRGREMHAPAPVQASAPTQTKRHNMFDDDSDSQKPKGYRGPNLEQYFHERDDHGGDAWGGNERGYGSRGGGGSEDRFGGSSGRPDDRYGEDRYGGRGQLDRSSERDRYGGGGGGAAGGGRGSSASDRYGGSSDRYVQDDRYGAPERPSSRGYEDDRGGYRGASAAGSGRDIGDDWAASDDRYRASSQQDRYGRDSAQDRYGQGGGNGGARGEYGAQQQDRYGAGRGGGSGNGRYDQAPSQQDRYGQGSRGGSGGGGGYGDDWGSARSSPSQQPQQHSRDSSRGASPAPSSLANYKDAKSISSSQFFPKDDRASDADRARLGRFQGATAISSDDFHGRPRQQGYSGGGGGGGGRNGDLISRVTETAKSDLLSITGSLIEGGKKFASGVSAWLDGDDDTF